MPSHTRHVLGLLLLSTSTGCATQAHSSSPGTARAVTVMCNSTVNHDTGFCQGPANESCGGRARLAGVISSVEMTGRQTGQLYTITARYECEGS